MFTTCSQKISPKLLGLGASYFIDERFHLVAGFLSEGMFLNRSVEAHPWSFNVKLVAVIGPNTDRGEISDSFRYWVRRKMVAYDEQK